MYVIPKLSWKPSEREVSGLCNSIKRVRIDKRCSPFGSTLCICDKRYVAIIKKALLNDVLCGVETKNKMIKIRVVNNLYWWGIGSAVRIQNISKKMIDKCIPDLAIMCDTPQ